MKKVVCMLMLVLTLGMLSGCWCEHVWSDATCSIPRTCTQCEETEGEPLGHSWSGATCTQAKTCIRCAETEGEPLVHNWLYATRETPKTCVDCGATEGDVLSVEEIYPDGTRRYESRRFLMNTEDFLLLYLNDLEENGYNFSDLGVSAAISDQCVRYFFINNDVILPQILSISIITDTESEQISMISVGFDHENATQELLNAAWIAYKTCHGAMDEEKWDKVWEDYSHMGYNNGWLTTRYFCDNLVLIYARTNDRHEIVIAPDMTLDILDIPLDFMQ